MSFDNTIDEYKAIFDSLIETPARTTCRLRVLCTPCEKVIANNQTVTDIVKLIIEQVKKDSIDYIVVLKCDQQYSKKSQDEYYFFYHTITGTHAPIELQKQYEFVNYRTQWSCKEFKLLVERLNPDDILYQAQLQLSQIQKPQPSTTSSMQTDAAQQQNVYMSPMFQQLSHDTGSQIKEYEQYTDTADFGAQTLNTQTDLRFEDFLIAERDKNFAFYHGIKPVGKPYVDIYEVSNAFYATCAQQIFIRKYASTLAVCDVTDIPYTIMIPHECTATMSALLISRRGQGLPISMFQGILPQLRQALLNKRLWYQQRVVAVRKVAILVFVKDRNGDSYLRSICNKLNDVAGYNVFTTKQIDSYKNGFFVNEKHNNSSFIVNDNDCSQVSSQNITITNTRDIF